MSGRVIGLSNRLARLERVACGFLAAFVTFLILFNVVTRSFDVALFWVDELAVYGMIWMALIGASMLLHERRHIAVTLLTGSVSDQRRRAMTLIVDCLVLALTGGFVLMCLAWYDPIGLIHHDFDIDEFAAHTFNFIYQEPTNTLGMQKFWIWLVVPIVSVTMTLHSLAHLLADLNMAEQHGC